MHTRLDITEVGGLVTSWQNIFWHPIQTYYLVINKKNPTINPVITDIVTYLRHGKLLLYYKLNIICSYSWDRQTFIYRQKLIKIKESDYIINKMQVVHHLLHDMEAKIKIVYFRCLFLSLINNMLITSMWKVFQSHTEWSLKWNILL